MCALPASLLNVHAAIEKGLADERISFALGGILFLQLHGLTDQHSMASKTVLPRGRNFSRKT
jgi:hypothetical protein